MSEPSFRNPENMNREELMSALFASIVMQQANMAMLYLGQTPHPETRQPVRDLEAAQMFIQQLEMLETKTRGNLSTEEAALLKHSLSSVRMAFVQAVGSGGNAAPAVGPEPASAARTPAPEATAPGGETAGPESAISPGSDDERKKFVKKY